MRKLPILAAATAFAAASTVGVATASHSNGQGPPFDFIQGTGQLANGGQFHFNARSEPGGGNPRGKYYAKDAFGPDTVSFTADVECLRVMREGSATVANVGVRVTKRQSALAPQEGSGLVFRVEDQGEPGAQQDRFFGRNTVDPQECQSPTSELQPTMPLERGNFVIHEAP